MFIVLLSIILLAFVGKSQLANTASASFSSSFASNELSRDAANSVVRSLQAEIVAESTNLGSATQPFYTATNWTNTATAMLPQLDQDAQTAAANGIPNFLQSSASLQPAYAGAPASLASPIATDAPALNSRVLPLSRWNAPALLTTAQNNALPVPHWIYVNRQGPVGLPAAQITPALSQPVLSGAINPSYVIGRYAYRVYDISGLIDLNVAGFPAAVRDNTRTGRKGSLAWLDFFNTSPIAGFNPSTAPTSLLNWRGPVISLANYVDSFGQANGFLLTPPTTSEYAVNRLLSRGDLIQLVSSQQFAGEFTDPATFLTEVTSFNRDVNAPTFAPPNPPNDSPAALNPAIPTVLVSTAFQRRDGTSANVGDVLVNQRFPLSKIALLATNGPSSAQLAQISSYFGLAPASNDEWNYTAGTVMDSFPDGTTRERLKTLAEVSAEGREPNFFELLQAGIQADTLGEGAENCFFANSYMDQNIARHVLQIGLNIIDQYDADDNPTVIARTPFDQLKNYPDSPDPDIAGIENLPYIQMIGHNYFRRDITEPVGTNPNYPVNDYPNLTCFYQFQLWNPHQNASALAEGQFRIVADGTVRVNVRNPDNVGTSAVNDLTGEAITYTYPNTYLNFSWKSDPANFTTPRLLTPSMTGVSVSPSFDPNNPANVNDNTYQVQNANIIGFWQGNCNAPYHGFSTNPSPPATPLALKSHYERYGTISGATDVNASAPGQFESDPYTDTPSVNGTQGVSFQLQKLDSNGKWLPVETIPVLTNQGASEMATTHNPLGGGGTTFDYSGRTVLYPYTIDKHWIFNDPRTVRFGPMHANEADVRGVINAPFPKTGQWYFSGWLPQNRGIPTTVGGTVDTTLPILYENTSGTTLYYRDRSQANSGKVRHGDAPTANPYYSTATRPIMLNRPFTSVAELGYAFRDLPWKTVNFAGDLPSGTNALSADAALLDLFSLTQTPVREGTLNLNAASDATLTALLSQTDEGNGVALSSTDVASAVSDLRAYLGTRQSPLHALRSNADLSLLLQNLTHIATWSKPKQEAIALALADIVNTRTWNVLIDVVGQTGHLANAPGHTLADFVVSGQKHFFVQVAIDRATGNIVDQISEEAPN